MSKKNYFSQAYCIYFNIKIINSQQAKVVYNNKNTKAKPFKTNANIWCNKICKTSHLSPNYINVKVKGNNPQNINKRQGSYQIHTESEIEILYKKK